MQTRLVSIRYDAAQGAFEGRVDLSRDGRTFRYPTRLEAPESTPSEVVEAELVQRALRMAESDRPRTAAAPARPGFLRHLLSALSPVAEPVLSGIPVRTADPRHPRSRLR